MTGGGYGSGLWPVLLALLVVLIPTACVLWFLNQVVHNERLAAKQRVVEAYRGYLPLLRTRLETYWQQQAAALETAAGKSPAPAAFAACVRTGLADSVVCYDATGRLAYPVPAVVPKGQPAEGDVWETARQLEYAHNEPAAAAAAYAGLAKGTSDDALAARALQAQARCLARAGTRDEAVRLLTDTLGASRFAQVLDPEGRLLVADAQLRALELDGRSPGAHFPANCRPACPAGGRLWPAADAGRAAAVSDERTRPADRGRRGGSHARGRGACGGLSGKPPAGGRRGAAAQRIARCLAICLAPRSDRRLTARCERWRAGGGDYCRRCPAAGSPRGRGAA